MRLALNLALIVAVLPFASAAGPGGAETEEIAGAIDAFFANKEAISTFATHVDGEHTLSVLDPSLTKQKSASGLFASVVAAHGESEWYRCDINHDVGRDGVTLPSSKWETGLIWKGEKFTFVNQQEIRRKDVEQPGKGSLPLFDPWTLSISSYGMFRFGNAGRDGYSRVKTVEHLKEAKYLGGGIYRGTWVLPPTYIEKFEVDFAEQVGFMPVQTRSWIRNRDGDPSDLSEKNWPTLNSVAKTEWRQREDGRWYPLSTEMRGFSGPGGRPAIMNQWTFKYSWAPESEVNGEWGKVHIFSSPSLASAIQELATSGASKAD